MEETPLEIMTISPDGSSDRLYVWGRVCRRIICQIHLTSTVLPDYCSSNSLHSLPTTLPTDKVKVWRISVLMTSSVRVIVHCNEVEVLNTVISSDTCSYSDWSVYWNQGR